HITPSLSHRYAPHRALPSFPTRRSSDLRRSALPATVLSGPVPHWSAAVRTAGSAIRLPAAGTAPVAAPYAWWLQYCSVRCRQYRSEEHTSELQSRENLVCRLLLEKKKMN